MNTAIKRFAAHMGSASILTLATTVHAQQTAPAQTAPGPSATNSGGHQERETCVKTRDPDMGPLSLPDGVRHPPLALDRVDILVDGAPATYGSDAIAGVMNVILKRNFEKRHGPSRDFVQRA